MAAGLGFKTFTTGEVLTAGDVNGYLMQGVLVFASEAARNAAITSPQEGQFAYTKDNNSLWYYTGSAWAASGATGDIEGVTATSPLTGGGTSGTVTVGIQDASTTQRGSVQLSDSTSTTSSVLAATPTAVKSAYDLAAAAIPKSLIDAAGDLIVGTAADTAGRLAMGTANQVLRVNSGGTALEYATPAGGGKVLQVVQGSYSTSTTVSTTTFTDTGLSLSITPTLATSKILVLVNQYVLLDRTNVDQGVGLKIFRDATEVFATGAAGGAGYMFAAGASSVNLGVRAPLTYLDSPATTSATTYKTQGRPVYSTNSGVVVFQHGTSPSVITLMEIGA